MGDIGGYVIVKPFQSVAWVLSKDGEVFTPCPGHEKFLQDFLEGGNQS